MIYFHIFDILTLKLNLFKSQIANEPLVSRAIRLPEASPGAVTGATQVVHLWAIPQQSIV
jgi:hypothetical protein